MAAVALAVSAIIAAGLVFRSRTSSLLGGYSEKAAPRFRLEEVRSGRAAVALEAYRGRPVVLNFWASWCTPCTKEMPALEGVHRRLGDRVAFLGVDHTDSRRNAVAQLERAQVSYPSGYDPTGVTAGDYKVVGMPTTVFIDPDGRITGRHAGELSSAQLESLLARLFPKSVA